MLAGDLSKKFCPCPKPGVVKKKKVTEIKGKKHTQTKAKEIPQKVKKVVYERDKQRCIFCGKIVPLRCACCHFIPKSAGGLGVEENIFTACDDCHREQDNGLNTKEFDKRAKRHLKSIYGAKWKIENLIYKK